MTEVKKHTIVALVQDQPGVLNRIASLFRRRMFNIDSLAVGPSERPGLSRLTLVIKADPSGLEQVVKQLYKLIDVIKISELDEQTSVQRELALIKVSAPAPVRAEIIPIIDIFRAKIIDVAPDALIIEATGSEDKVDALISLLRSYGIQEVVRTGRVAMTRASARARAVQAKSA
ncbi:MAG: acetolactate synthase small subunit [Chloroflexota bacterium]